MNASHQNNAITARDTGKLQKQEEAGENDLNVRFFKFPSYSVQ
jgi:hypothetical protein